MRLRDIDFFVYIVVKKSLVNIQFIQFKIQIAVECLKDSNSFETSYRNISLLLVYSYDLTIPFCHTILYSTTPFCHGVLRHEKS